MKNSILWQKKLHDSIPVGSAMNNIFAVIPIKILLISPKIMHDCIVKGGIE